MRLQGAADARRRVRSRTRVLQVPGNEADAVSCERIREFCLDIRLRLVYSTVHEHEGAYIPKTPAGIIRQN
jgi:hypothetical protein